MIILLDEKDHEYRSGQRCDKTYQLLVFQLLLPRGSSLMILKFLFGQVWISGGLLEMKSRKNHRAALHRDAPWCEIKVSPSVVKIGI